MLIGDILLEPELPQPPTTGTTHQRHWLQLEVEPELQTDTAA